MPRPASGVQTAETQKAGITFTDWKGQSISQALPTAGGNQSMADIEALANAIADCSNACYSELRNNETKSWKDGDLRTLDDAEASVHEVIVLVFPHDTDPDKNREVLIPAYDAQYILPGGAVWLGNTDIQAVITASLAVFNDDDNALNPDNYHGENVYAFTSTRKGTSKKGTKVRTIPLAEATDSTQPSEQPGENP